MATKGKIKDSSTKEFNECTESEKVREVIVIDMNTKVGNESIAEVVGKWVL